MIRRSLSFAALAAMVSLGAHLGGLFALWRSPEVLVEGGAPATVARLGSDSFEDLAEGTLVPDQPEEAQEAEDPEIIDAETIEETTPKPDVLRAEPPRPEKTEVDETTSDALSPAKPQATAEPESIETASISEPRPIEPQRPPSPIKPSQIPAASKGDVTSERARVPQPAQTNAASPHITASVTAPPSTTSPTLPTLTAEPNTDVAVQPQPVAPSSVQATSTPDLASPETPAPRAALSPLTPPKPAAALQPVQPKALAQPTPVPQQPPTDALPTPDVAQVLAALPNTNEAAPLLSKRPSKRPREIEQAAPKPKPIAKAKPKPNAPQAPRGNAQVNARKGASDGQKTASAAAASANTGKQAQASGNARASNYPGLVMRKIQRRKPRTNLRGTAVVSFRIASGGGLASISLSKSSGSTKLDQLAMNAVRRAAPFPKPPPGAKTGFSIQIKGR